MVARLWSGCHDLIFNCPRAEIRAPDLGRIPRSPFE